MRARVAASIALAVAVSAALAGCTFLTPQATLKHYDPSDGVSATIGDVVVLNALIVSDDGDDGNLLMSAVNKGTDDIELNLQYGGIGSKVDVTVELPAGETTDVGFGEDGQQFLANIATKPGGLLSLYLQYGSQPGKQLQVPVLTGSLSQYSDLLPTPTPTPTPTATATPNPIASGEPDPNATTAP